MSFITFIPHDKLYDLDDIVFIAALLMHVKSSNVSSGRTCGFLFHDACNFRLSSLSSCRKRTGQGVQLSKGLGQKVKIQVELDLLGSFALCSDVPKIFRHRISNI